MIIYYTYTGRPKTKISMENKFNKAFKSKTKAKNLQILDFLGQPANIDLSLNEKKAFLPIMFDYLDDKSKIVKYCAIQAVGHLENNNKNEIIKKINQYKNISKSIDKIIDITKEKLSN